MGRGQSVPPPPPPPVFKNSEVKYGDTTISKTYQDSSGNIVTQYIPDPIEEERKKQAQIKLNQVMGTLGKTAPEMSAQFDSTKKAFVDSAAKSFQEQYDPALKSLREDIASRFGTLNSSQFISGLNDLEKNRTNALAEIASKGERVKSDLVNQDESRKLNELQALGGILSDSQNALLSNTKASLTASEAMNDFLNGQWMQQLRAFTADINNRRQMMTSMVNTGINAGASIIRSFISK